MQKIYILGGDRRQQYLQENLKAEGYFTYSLGLSADVSKERFLEELRMEYAPIVLLPLPASKDGKTIFMPQSQEACSLAQLLTTLKKSAVILGFQMPQAFCEAARQRGITVKDLYQEDLIDKNAMLTAKATLLQLHSILKTPLQQEKICLLGYGHVGKAVYKVFAEAQSCPTVFVRRKEVVSALQNEQIQAFPMDVIKDKIHEFDLFINTVPSLLLTEQLFKNTKEKAIFIELASKPYGIDFEAAKRQKKTALCLGGLPGKVFPAKAAAAMLEAIQKEL